MRVVCNTGYVALVHVKEPSCGFIYCRQYKNDIYQTLTPKPSTRTAGIYTKVILQYIVVIHIVGTRRHIGMCPIIEPIYSE